MTGSEGVTVGSDVLVAAVSGRGGCCDWLVSFLTCLLPGKSSSQKSLDLPLSIDDLGVAFPLLLNPGL